jgi:hypothetical protein
MFHWICFGTGVFFDPLDLAIHQVLELVNLCHNTITYYQH